MTYLNTQVNVLEALDEIKTSFERRDFKWRVFNLK